MAFRAWYYDFQNRMISQTGQTGVSGHTRRRSEGMMRYAIQWLLIVAALDLSIPSARGHYNMLLPERHSVRRGEPVTLLYQWGHPFEHQLFDAPAPEKVFVLSPDGKS